MKHDYEAVSQACAKAWLTGVLNAVDLKAVTYALAMMQKMEEPSDTLIHCGHIGYNKGAYNNAYMAVKYTLKAMLEQAEKEIA